MHDIHSLFLLPASHKVFWTFIEVEEEEADEEEKKHQPAHREKKIPPSMLVERGQGPAGTVVGQRSWPSKAMRSARIREVVQETQRERLSPDYRSVGQMPTKWTNDQQIWCEAGMNSAN